MGQGQSAEPEQLTKYSKMKFNKNFHSSNLVKGDAIEFSRRGYCHWALYIGDGQIVQFNPAGEEEGVGLARADVWFDGAVTKASLAAVSKNDQISVRNHNYDLVKMRPWEDIETIMDITMSGSFCFQYCLSRFNCEHFVKFLKHGIYESGQIRDGHAQVQIISNLPAFYFGRMPKMKMLDLDTVLRDQDKYCPKDDLAGKGRVVRLSKICQELAETAGMDPALFSSNTMRLILSVVSFTKKNDGA